MEIREYTNYKETEILRLYNSVGWTAYTDNPETLRLGFKNSLRVLAAYEGEELLGLIRAVGDGYTILYIQDILAFPEHQREGIGSALIKALIEQFSKVRQIVLSTDAIPKNIAFYEAQGFVEMSKIGCCSFMK